MKQYKQELATFFQEKKANDEKIKKTLTKMSFKEKQNYIKEHRTETKIEGGTFVLDMDRNFERKQFIRDIYYFDNLVSELKNKYQEFNSYKYDVLYELVDMDEAKYDSYETEINEIKQKRDEFISRRSLKQDEMNSHIESLKLQIKERMDDYKDSEEKAQIYREVIELRKEIFSILEPRLSMINNSLVINYLPIKGNERNIKNMNESINESPESLNIGSEVSINSESLDDSSPNENSSEE